MKWLGIILLYLAGIALIFGIAFCYGRGSLEEVEPPKPLIIKEFVEVEKVIIEERVVTHYVNVEVPVLEYRNIPAREFESVQEFIDWYKAQDFKILFPSGDYKVDCDDYADRLQRTALQQGYSISQALAINQLYYGVRVTGIRGGHAGNMVLIDGIYYWIEPNPERFWMVRIVERD